MYVKTGAKSGIVLTPVILSASKIYEVHQILFLNQYLTSWLGIWNASVRNIPLNSSIRRA